MIFTKIRNRNKAREEFEKFIQIIQKNYFVSPDFSNERLIKQSGAFMLPGSFFINFDIGFCKNRTKINITSTENRTSILSILSIDEKPINRYNIS